MQEQGGDSLARETPRPAARPRAEDGRSCHGEARALWTELLARLTQVAETFAQPDMAPLLKQLGVRSSDAALASLAREYAKAAQIALTTGAVPRPHEIMRRARELGRPGDLQAGFMELSRSYRALIHTLRLPADCQRHRWLEGRALVHVAQADALQRQR